MREYMLWLQIGDKSMQEFSVYNQYIKEIKCYKLLSKEEEVELANKIKLGDKVALQQLINSNLRLVVKLARSYESYSSNFMDIIQEGNMGLMVAAKKFSPSFNVRFASYATLWIKQAISRYIVSHRSSIRLPMRKASIVKEVQKFRIEFKKQLNKEPSLQEISTSLGVDEKQLRQLHKYIYNKMESLDACIAKNDKKDTSLYDYIPSQEYENPENIYLKKVEKMELYKQLNILSARDRDIIKNRYCLNTEHRSIPFRILGDKYSISAESVRQIEIRALKRLRDNKERLIEAMSI